MASATLTSDRAEIDKVLAGGGEMGALMRSMDWPSTALGPVSSWPQSLRTAVGICLTSRFPILIWWGPEMVKIYNDAYRPMLGDKHPRAMGARGRDVWPEIWHIIGPMLEGVLTRGAATWSENQLLLLERHGFAEECYFTFSYSPIRDDSEGIAGVFSAISETTRQVLSERRIGTLRALAAATTGAGSAEDACRRAAQAVAEDPHELPFLLLYLLDGPRARLAGVAGVDPDAAAASAWPLAEVAQENRARVIEGVSLRPTAEVPQPRSALILPIALPGEVAPSALMVAGLSARLRFDEGYRSFLELVAGHVSTALASGRALEEAQKRADALAEIDRAKTTFFSNVSHEFRTPLTLMLGPTDDLLDGAHGALSEVQRDQLELIRRSQLRLQRLVNALLEFSRIEAGRGESWYQPTDLAELTRDAASSFRSAFERAGLAFVVDCPPLGQPVFVDHGMWETIVFNLVSNALKFTLQGRVEVALKPAGGSVALVVKDTGAGVPAEEMPRLFERFHRIEGVQARTHEGSGIGLALVQELVKLHGGEIQAASVPGGGTTFTIRVPFGSAHLPRERIQPKAAGVPTSVKAAVFVEEALRWLPANQPAALPSAAAENAPRILLADDNADMRDYVRRLLEPHYRVEAVGDGQAALAIARARPPDLILTDVMMPGVDGFELLRRLRQGEHTRRIPVVMLSARAGEEARIEGLSAGAEDYLSKPFSGRELLARVRTHLELSRLREELRGQREQLYALFMQAPVPICVFRGHDLVFEMANPRYLEVSGRRDVVGRTFLEAIPEARGQGFDDLMRGVMATGVPYVGKEYLVRLDRDGDGVPEDTWFDFIYAPVRDERGVADRVMAVVHDVTEKVLERRCVEQREERLRVMFETAEVSMWDEDLSAVKRLVDELAERHGAGLRAFLEAHPEVVDRAIGLVQVRDVNPATLRLFGAGDKAELLQSLHAIFVEQTRPVFLEEMLALAEGRTAFSGEAPMRTLAGEPLTVLVSWGAAQDDGAYQRVLVTLMDISAQNLVGAERESRVAQMEGALRFSEMLAGILGHDLRNPLSAIVMAASLLAKRADSELIARPVSRILSSSDRMQRMIAQLLDLTRVRLGGGIPLELREVDLVDITRHVIDELESALGREIALETAGDLKGTWDGDRLSQLLSNLVANACQHGHAGTPVRVRIDGASGDGVRVEVANQGVIPPEVLPLVFEPLSHDGHPRRGSSGLGLGLYITEQVVLAHGGTIRVASDEAQGTRVVVHLPRISALSSTTPARTPAR